jgi:hypothetical protein
VLKYVICQFGNNGVPSGRSVRDICKCRIPPTRSVLCDILYKLALGLKLAFFINTDVALCLKVVLIEQDAPPILGAQIA